MKSPERASDPIDAVTNERGVALAFVAMLLVVLLGMSALAIDLGMLFNARAEVQRVADAAAMAGAAALIDSPGDEDLAREYATDYALRNDVRAMGITLEPEDIDVELWRDRVRVRAYRSTDRGTGLANLFARALGFAESSVSAVAAAEAAVASGANCILPFALVDRWWETPAGRLADDSDLFDAGDIYNAGPLTAMPGSPTENTGYGTPDRGRVMRIYPGSTSDSPQPGWYYPVALDAPGGNAYRDAIAGCIDDSAVNFVGQDIDIEPGRMVGPTSQGFATLIGSDPTAYWDSNGGPDGGCVKRTDDGSDECVSGSTRVRPMILISPEEQPTSPGRQAVTIRNFVGVFVICQGVLNQSQSGCTGGGGNNPNSGVWVRFVDYRGSSPMSPDEAPPGSFLRVLRLVE